METMPFNSDMSPDDFEALKLFGLQVYGESKILESTTVDNPLVNTHKEDGTMKVRTALMKAEQSVKMAQQPPVPSYPYPEIPHMVPTAPIQPNIPTHFYQQHVPLPTPVIYPHPEPNGQLEFSFDPKTQDITNDLLKEISVKMSKIIKLLEKQSDPIKLKP